MRKTPGQLWGRCAKEAFFRKDFELKEKPESAVLRIFVDTGYELFLNGRFVACVDEWNNTRDYNVRMYLKPGRNVIAVHAINTAGHRGFAFELLLNGTDSVSSDESWKVADAELWGWMLSEYDDSAWSEPVVMPMEIFGMPQWSSLPGNDPERVISPIPNTPFFCSEVPKFVDSPFYTKQPESFTPSAGLCELLGPEYAESAKAHPPAFVRAKNLMEINAKNGTINADGFKVTASATARYEGPEFTIDFGEECCGYFRMRVESEKVVRFRICYGECLDECFAEPEPEIPLHRMLIETISLQPGVQEWESRMRVGFRFARIEFFHCPAKVEVDEFHVRNTLYPLAYRGAFFCSDESLNGIWKAGRKTLHLCMQEYYLDAIKRDRLLWVGDTRAESLYNYYLFGDTELFKFSMRELAKCQYENGAIGSAWGPGASLLWDYDAWWVIALHDYYMYTGDAAFLLELKQNLCRATDWLAARTNAEGLIDVPPNPLKLWMVVLDNSVGLDPFLNSLYLRALKASREACGLAGDAEGAARCNARIAKTEPAVRALLAKNPLKDRKSLYSHSTGIYEVIESLFSEGDSAAALALIRQRWGALLSCGADTLFEGMYSDSMPRLTERHENNDLAHISFCHGWTAGPCSLLSAWIAGIRPLEPGFKRFTVAPAPVDLTWFKTAVPTPHGEIGLVFRDGTYTLSVPENTTAVFRLNGKENEFGSGVHTIK